MADEGVKGVMMVDSPPHQPQKKKNDRDEYTILWLVFMEGGPENILILVVNVLVVSHPLLLYTVSKCIVFTLLRQRAS